MTSTRDADKLVNRLETVMREKARLELQAEAEQAAARTRAAAPAEPKRMDTAADYAQAAAASITPPAFTVDAVSWLR